MYAVYFDSDVKGLLKVNGDKIFDLSGRCQKAELNDCFIVEFYPYDNCFESFCDKINFRCLACQNSKVLFWNDCAVSVKLCPKRKRDVKPLVAFSQVVSMENTFTLCHDGSSFLLMESENQMQVMPIDFQMLSGKLSIENLDGQSVLRLDGQGENACYFGLYQMEPPFEPLYEGIGESFALEGTRIRRVKDCCVMSHARVENIYERQGFGFEPAGINLISFNKEFDKNLGSLLKIYAFLESVQEGILPLCQRFLQDDLMQDFTVELAKDFFGRFSDIVKSPLFHKENIVALLYEDGQNLFHVQHFCFTFEGGKISNFSKI